MPRCRPCEPQVYSVALMAGWIFRKQLREVAKLGVGDGPGHRTTRRVAHDKHHLRPGELRGELHAAEDVGVLDVAAIRALKMSPMPRLKRISAGARESMQPSSTPAGNCPEAVACCSARKSRWIFRPSRKRRLPSFHFSRIWSAVIWSRASFVSATTGGSCAAVSAGFAPQAPSNPTAAAVDVLTKTRLDGK